MITQHNAYNMKEAVDRIFEEIQQIVYSRKNKIEYSKIKNRYTENIVK